MKWLLILLVCVTAANADVTRKQTVSSQFMGANEGTTIEYYSADRHATESTLKWTRGMMKTATGGKTVESGSIVRLDKQLVWSINPKDKTYTEMTFEQFREMLKKGNAEVEKAEGERPDTAREEMYTWTVVDKSEAQPKMIGGWNCRNVRIEATGVSKADSMDKVIMTIDTWNSPDVPGAKEITEFGERYVKALGLDKEALTPGLMQASAMYQKQFKELIEAARKAPGEPVQSLMEIKRNQLKGPDIGKAIAEGAKNELMGKLPFGRKKEAPKEQKPEYEVKVKFSVTSTLTEASTSATDAAKYEIPAGYKLKK
ncbi:MAG TPA: hypothetical protein VGL38_00405 [bacterium]|jgi:hypothetical protein